MPDHPTRPSAAQVVILSDLHLGIGNALDDFHADAAFKNLLAAVATWQDAEVVLLGDTFDLWQAVKDDEIARPGQGIGLDLSGASERARLELIRTAHPDFFAAVSSFVKKGGRLTFVIGNHDHPLVHAEVQTWLRDVVGPVPIDLHYENPRLALYAEHCNQFDRNNCYGSGEVRALGSGREAAGYFFVKLFWNRVELLDPDLDDAPGVWGKVWHVLRSRGAWGLIAKALGYFREYWTDPRVPAGKRLDIIGLRPAAPGGLEAAAVGLEAAAPGALTAITQAAAASPEVKIALRELCAAMGVSEDELAAAASVEAAVAGTEAVAVPDDVTWANLLYDTKRGASFLRPGEPVALEFPRYRNVVFGHTHDERTVGLKNGARYVNTGTWTGPAGRGRYPVAIARVAGREPRVGMAWFVDDGAGRWEGDTVEGQ
jgi:UDP-2,3-diacylglucosamine pyrophosphatase LpxH